MSVLAAPNDAGFQHPISRRRRLYVLAVTTVVYFFYMLDRNAVVVTQESFKAEFGLSDTQVGLVTGLLYGAAYALVGLPIGWLTQRLHRVRLLSMLIGIWSGVTLLSGFASKFWHLALARTLVGAAESGGAPVSLSVLHPLFPKSMRATVSSIFFAGAGVGAIVSFLAGGYLANAFGWRAVFFIYGAPGIALALLILFTLPEPPRTEASATVGRPGLFKDMGILLGNRDLLPIYAGSILYATCNAAIGSWMVPFFMRVHHVALPVAGSMVALALGVCGTVGSVLAAMLADRFEQKRKGGLLLLMAMFALFNGAIGIVAVMTADVTLCMVFFCLWGATALAYSGPSTAAISELAPPRLLGLGFSLFSVLCNLIGSGLGPLAVGMISDRFQVHFGTDSVRPALMIFSSIQLLTMAAYLVAMRRWRNRVTAS